MMQSKRYAVTGGIGSGKTVVLELLERKGYAVFSCDEISRELWRDADYRKGLAELFPTCALGGEIDKKALSELVFSDENALARLNAYAHPCIMRELFRRMEGHPIAFAEVPLLFEGGYETEFDGIIAVRRGVKERMDSVIARDGLSENDVQQRMDRQFDPSLLETKHCFILENNGSIEELEQGIERFLTEQK